MFSRPHTTGQEVVEMSAEAGWTRRYLGAAGVSAALSGMPSASSDSLVRVMVVTYSGLFARNHLFPSQDRTDLLFIILDEHSHAL